jgi:hypothetical protein
MQGRENVARFYRTSAVEYVLDGPFTGEDRTMPFSSTLREKLLLWCDRRCCLCKKGCDVFIEVHHIVAAADGGDDDEDNAIPLCFDCHAKVSHYDSTQPIGTRFKPEELKKRRNQIYDEYTRHLVPVLHYRVHQNGRTLPMVGFSLTHTGNAPPVQAIVRLDTYVDGKPADIPGTYGLYRGDYRWHLNPGEGVHGQFEISQDALADGAHVRVGVNITIYDVYDRPHELLPVAYGLMPDGKDWFLDPIDPKKSAAQVPKVS